VRELVVDGDGLDAEVHEHLNDSLRATLAERADQDL
jgi:hypothetical protein